MAWFLENMDMLDAMADIARDPEKLAAFKESPVEYLKENTELDDSAIEAITTDDHAAITKALMSKVNPDD
jgi:hypothetical protein